MTSQSNVPSYNFSISLPPSYNDVLMNDELEKNKLKKNKQNTKVLPSEKTFIQSMKLSIRLKKTICYYFYADSLKGKCYPLMV
jgi:hypothetical protein